jgi:hypothetical protein
LLVHKLPPKEPRSLGLFELAAAITILLTIAAVQEYSKISLSCWPL